MYNVTLWCICITIVTMEILCIFDIRMFVNNKINIESIAMKHNSAVYVQLHRACHCQQYATHSGLHVKGPILLSDFKQVCIFFTDFHKSPQYQIPQKSVQWELHRYMPTDGYGKDNRSFLQPHKHA